MRKTADGPLIRSVIHEVDGLRWRVRSGGPNGPDQEVPRDVPTVVLVHGVGLASDYMMPTARALAEHCRVLVPDLPGYGKSDKPAGTPDAVASAALVLRWMDTIGLKRAAFLGNSFGCNIAVELAIAQPERVECLILQGPSMDPAGRSAWRGFLRGLKDVQLLRLVPIGIYQYRRAGLGRIRDTFRAVLRHPIEKRLPLVTVPALVVHGSRDPITPVHWGEQAARLLPHGSLRLIKGTTHVAVYLAPRELAEISLPFVRRHHTRDVGGVRGLVGRMHKRVVHH